MTEKNGLDLKRSTHRKMQNDRKKEVVLAQSGSSNVAVKNELNTKQQQHNDPEHREGDSSESAAVKSKVNVNQCNQEVRDGFSTERNPVKDCILDEGTKFGLCSRYDCCSGSLSLPSGFRPGSWFLLASPGAWIPVLVFACGCCSESEDSLNLLRIQHSNSLCEYVSFFFLELRVHHCAVHSVHNSLLLHLANRASFTCKTDSFSWGHGPDALACKARPSSDKCGTSLSVSLSLSIMTQP